MTLDCYFLSSAPVKGLEQHDRCTHRGPYKGHVCETLRMSHNCPGLVTKAEAEYQIEAAAERDVEERNNQEKQCYCNHCRGVE